MLTRSAHLAVCAALVLNGCSSAATQPTLTPVMPESAGNARGSSDRSDAASLNELYNLDYSNGSISVFRVSNGTATMYSRFTPSRSGAQGLAVDRQGRIYTTITASNSSPCSACVEVFTDKGQLIAQLSAPILPGAPNPPALTDLSLDARGNIYVSDLGQQAVYFYSPLHQGSENPPTIVVQNSQNAASVLTTPDGNDVFVSGGCGFASVRPYTRIGSGKYQGGTCFGIGTIALIGGTTGNGRAILTPVDGVPGLVSVSSPDFKGRNFRTPGGFQASISGVALTGSGALAYVADHHAESVYAFARPVQGWIPGHPKLLATYKGFKNLDIIAVRP
jgi:hypothetical protein